MFEAEALAMYAEFQMWKGDWESAENAATDSLGSNPGVETLAWRVLGSIQSRRGRNEARAAIDRMWSLVRPERGPSVADPAAAVSAEYFWLSDDRDPEVLRASRNSWPKASRSARPGRAARSPSGCGSSDCSTPPLKAPPTSTAGSSTVSTRKRQRSGTRRESHTRRASL